MTSDMCSSYHPHMNQLTLFKWQQKLNLILIVLKKTFAFIYEKEHLANLEDM